MKIAVLGIRGFPGIQGGVEKHCEDLYSRFNKNVHFVVYRRKPYLNAETLSANYDNISFVDLPSTRIKGFEAVVHTFLSCVHTIFHRPDVVHVHNMGPGLFIPLLKLAGLQVVMTYHSVNYEQKKWGFFSRQLLRLCEKISLGCADKVIFVNRFRLEYFSKKIQSKSVYIPNGIVLPEKNEDTTFLQKFGIKPGKYLLCVGRMSSEKGFDTLIRAANLLEEVEQVVIAGGSDHDTSYFEYLHTLDTNKKVIFTGLTKRDGLSQLYSNARLYVLPSTTEGFPLVMLEAMSYGLPMVVSDISATHLIELDKNDYAKPADVDSFSQHIRRKLATTPEGYREKYILDEYKWERVVDDTFSVFDSVAKKN